MDKTVFIVAPAGSGKSQHAERIRELFGCEGIVDGWVPGDPVQPGHLHLAQSGAVAMEPVNAHMLAVDAA